MATSAPAELPVMRRLWQRMAEIYGYRWTSAFGEDASASAGQTWAKGLAGLTPAQIGAGLEAALASADDWPPTLPAFRAMCFGLPPFAAVRSEMIMMVAPRRLDADERTIASSFSRLVWSLLDTHRWRNMDAERADRLLREAYDLAREHVMRGGDLPPEPAAFIAQQPEQRTPSSPESARAHLDSIAATLGVESAA